MDRVHVRDARRRERADAGFQEIVKDTTLQQPCKVTGRGNESHGNS